MQFRMLSAIWIFLGSYLPLSLILLVQNFDFSAISRPFCLVGAEADCELPLLNPIMSISAVAICTFCFLLTLMALRLVRPSNDIVITEAQYVPTELVNYTLPYVVSFMSIDYQDIGKFIGMAVFLAWMFWITFKSGQIILNPLLIVLGWRLYDVKYRSAGDSKILAACSLVKGELELGSHKHYPVQDIQIIKPKKA